MTTSPYVTVREAAQILGISEGKLMSLSDEKKLQAYRIAGQYVRFKREDILSLRNSGNITAETVKFPYTMKERVQDLLSYNDFYIAAFVVILALLFIIFFVK